MSSRRPRRAPTARILPFRPPALSPFRPEGTLSADIITLPRPFADQPTSPEDFVRFLEGGGFSS